ncbi:MAG: hypothetical protein FD124_3982, partial [Alphaproteobacteria bacterium]
MQAFGAQLGDAFHGVTRGQQLEHLVEQARRRHVADQLRHLADRARGRRVDREAQLGRQAHGAQHAHRVFAVAGLRLADHAQGFRLDIGDAVVIVDDRLGDRVVVQRVDRKVAARRVFHLVAENVV